MSKSMCSNVSKTTGNGRLHLKLRRLGEWEAFIVINNETMASISPLLQQNKLDPNLCFRGTTLLAAAIHRNSADIVKMLLEHGANPNKKSNENDRYEPPIITATRLKYLHIVIILAEQGADLTHTNFYGEDALYQAVVANAYGILSYFLSTKPHGSCVHASGKLCPMQRAILEGESYASKRKCFLILVKYRYTCSCHLSTNESAQFAHLMTYKNRATRNDLLKWVYLSFGINLPPLGSTKSQQGKELNVLPFQMVTLTNLSRISIRSTMSKVAKERKHPLGDEISKLPLPPKLIQFVLMSELAV